MLYSLIYAGSITLSFHVVLSSKPIEIMKKWVRQMMTGRMNSLQSTKRPGTEPRATKLVATAVNQLSHSAWAPNCYQTNELTLTTSRKCLGDVTGMTLVTCQWVSPHNCFYTHLQWQPKQVLRASVALRGLI